MRGAKELLWLSDVILKNKVDCLMGLLCADGRAEGPVYDPCIFYHLLEARMQQFDIIDAFIVRCEIPDCENMIVKDCHWNFVARMTVH